MSQYVSAAAILLMVLSPPLIPAIVAVVHKTVLGIRAFANRRQPAVAPSLS
jgi:hypothetical protein